MRREPVRTGHEDLLGGEGVQHIEVGEAVLGDECEQPFLAAAAARVEEHARVTDAGVLAQHRRDLTEFDAVPADLDLVVTAAEIDHAAAGDLAYAVAGAVHPAAGAARVGDEPRGGRGRGIVIAERDLVAAHVQFADGAHRNRA